MNEDLRQRVRKRDNFSCQQCNEKDKKLDTHHIIPVDQGGSDDLKNLITLCVKCHKVRHRKKIEGKLVTFDMPRKIMKEFKHIAIDEDKTMTEAFNEALELYLSA